MSDLLFWLYLILMAILLRIAFGYTSDPVLETAKRQNDIYG